MSAEVATAVELLQQLAVLHIFTLASEGTWFSHELQTKECNGIKKNLRHMQCASAIQSLSAPSTKWTSLCLMLSSQKQGGALIKNVGNHHPVGIFGRWYRDLCECLCCCFSWDVFARAKWIQGW
jgi:hypothetical protein